MDAKMRRVRIEKTVLSLLSEVSLKELHCWWIQEVPGIENFSYKNY